MRYGKFQSSGVADVELRRHVHRHAALADVASMRMNVFNSCWILKQQAHAQTYFKPGPPPNTAIVGALVIADLCFFLHAQPRQRSGRTISVIFDVEQFTFVTRSSNRGNGEQLLRSHWSVSTWPNDQRQLTFFQ